MISLREQAAEQSPLSQELLAQVFGESKSEWC
jgi:hypothetical protein